MRVLGLKLHNILSIEDAEITFENSGLVLVEGYNHDDGRANGAGKSAIFNGLAFALYGKIPRKITVSEVLRKGAKYGFAEVNILCGGAVYRVKRSRPSRVEFKKGDQEIQITQEEFEKIIGLNYEQFIISMYTAQDSTSRFLLLNDTDKKNFLLRLMDLDEFKKCRDISLKELTQLKAEVDTCVRDSERIMGAITAHKNTYIQDTSEIVKSIAKSAETVSETLGEIRKLEKVQPPNLDEYIEVENKIILKRSEIADFKVRRAIHMNEFNKLADDVNAPFVPHEPDAECPHCNGELTVSGKLVMKADDNEQIKKAFDDRLRELKSKMETVHQTIQVIDKKLVRETELNSLQEKIRTKRNEESKDYHDALQRVSELKVLMKQKQLEAQVEQQKLKINEKIERLVKDLMQNLKEVEVKMSDFAYEMKVYDHVNFMFSPAGAQAYIMDSLVDSFNEIVNDYVGMIWNNATYELKSYKENKSGDVKAKFSDDLVIGGIKRSIGSLSGGELRALSLAVDFTIIRIIANQFGLALNPVIMDEPFQGIDAVGKELIFEMLEKMAIDRQIWIIDHGSELKAAFNKTIKVEKRNGVSSIVNF